MPEQVRSERKTQDRVVALFTDPAHPDCLGYRYLGVWSKRANKRAVEPAIVREHLEKRELPDLSIPAAPQAC